ncbi:MAG: hypothetical protein PF689_06480 [Deltaproteobacteria bacterium]|jgi:hypothetical protein|nr:hypothetical protein [Deltaproteobacteria bacterium]
MRKIIFLIPLIFIFSGCDEDKSTMEKLFSKMQSCDLLTEGEMSYIPDLSAYDKCYYNCLNKSDCDTLYDYFCENSTSEDVELCFYDCYQKYAFECGDGSLTNPGFVCNGEENCDDGSDEAGCPVFVCDSGEEVPLSFECNGYGDCDDGSDEAGCPVFVCDNDEEVPPSFECDGYEDCDDGSDEVDCPDEAELMCR